MTTLLSKTFPLSLVRSLFDRSGLSLVSVTPILLHQQLIRTVASSTACCRSSWFYWHSSLTSRRTLVCLNPRIGVLSSRRWGNSTMFPLLMFMIEFSRELIIPAVLQLLRILSIFAGDYCESKFRREIRCRVEIVEISFCRSSFVITVFLKFTNS